MTATDNQMPRRPTMALAAVAFAIIGLVTPMASAQASGPVARAHYAQPTTPVSPAIHAEINDIIARMNHAIDANDYPAYASFYAEDGYIDSGFGPLSRGREAIVASLNQSAPFITNKRHVASNVVINGGRNRVTAVYYLTVFERAAGLTLAGTALITDTFERRGGRWHVVSHVTRMDPATLAAMSAAMTQPAAPR
jgi:ketosteroid isomerase-like protein